MNTYTVRLDVSAVDNETEWNDWCELGSADLIGVEFHGLQPDGFEHWTVTADTASAAKALVESNLAYGVELVDVEGR